MKSETIGTATFETWTPQETQAALDANEIVLIDVRTPQEFMFEHIDGALLLPMSFFRADKLPGQSDKRIVFHCGSGVRSEMVSKKCIEAGFDQIAHVEGGMDGWKKSKLAYIGTNMATGAPQEIVPKVD